MTGPMDTFTKIKCQVCDKEYPVTIPDATCADCHADLPTPHARIETMLRKVAYWAPGPAPPAPRGTLDVSPQLRAALDAAEKRAADLEGRELDLEAKLTAATKTIDELRAQCSAATKRADDLAAAAAADSVARLTVADTDINKLKDKVDAYEHELAQVKAAAQATKAADDQARLAQSLAKVPLILHRNFTKTATIATSQTFTVAQGTLYREPVVEKRLFLTADHAANKTNAIKFQDSIARLNQIGSHDSIVGLLGGDGVTGDDPVIYMEFMAGGTLREKLTTTRNNRLELPWQRKLEIAIDTTKGLAFLHGKDFMHRQLNWDHILLDGAGRAKLGGLTRAREKSMDGATVAVGDFRWGAPELWQADDMKPNGEPKVAMYSEKIDIYSLGLVLVALDNHYVPYSHMGRSRESPAGDINILDALLHPDKPSNVFNHTFHFDETTYADAKAYQTLARECLAMNPDDRPSAQEVARRLGELLDRLLAAGFSAPTPSALPPISMTVHLGEAKDLRDVKAFGTQSPQAKLRVGTTVAASRIVDRGGRYPRFNQQFIFADVHVMDMTLEINIVSIEPILGGLWTTEGQIGVVTLPVYALLADPAAKFVNVMSSGAAVGSLSLKVSFDGDVDLFLRTYIARTQLYLKAVGSKATHHSADMKLKMEAAMAILPQL